MDRFDDVTCNFCHMSYRPNHADEQKHEKYHQQCLDSYEKTKKEYESATAPLRWFRPAIENGGVYRALNELNPGLAGFEYSGLSASEWESIQAGTLPLSLGQGNSGDGHDRYGIWTNAEGKSYSYHANWRCGRVHFEERKED